MRCTQLLRFTDSQKSFALVKQANSSAYDVLTHSAQNSYGGEVLTCVRQKVLLTPVECKKWTFGGISSALACLEKT